MTCAPPERGARPSLALRGVAKAYGSGAAAAACWRGVDFALAPGECVAIVGFSGSGKTTLLSILAGLLAPDAGAVEMEGRAGAAPPAPSAASCSRATRCCPGSRCSANVQLAVDAVHRGWPRARAPRARARLRAARGPRARAATSARASSRAACASAWRWRARSRRSRASCCSTSRSARSTRSRAARSRSRSRASSSASGSSAVLVTNDVDEAILLADRIVPLAPGAAGAHARRLVPRGAAAAARARRAEPRPGLQEAPQRGDGAPARARARAAAAPRAGRATTPLPALAPIALPPARQGRADERAPRAVRARARASTARAGRASWSRASTCASRAASSSACSATRAAASPRCSRWWRGCCRPAAGGVVLDGREIDGPGPDRGVVFQAPSLLPWLTALENVRLGVDRVYPHGTRAASATRSRRTILERVGLARRARAAARRALARRVPARRHRARLRARAEAAPARRALRHARLAHAHGAPGGAARALEPRPAAPR